MLIDTLEGRRHFSVTVTEGYPGFYEIAGTDDDDVIEIAVSQNDGTFTVDGETYADATIIHHSGCRSNTPPRPSIERSPHQLGLIILLPS